MNIQPQLPLTPAPTEIDNATATLSLLRRAFDLISAEEGCWASLPNQAKDILADVFFSQGGNDAVKRIAEERDEMRAINARLMGMIGASAQMLTALKHIALEHPGSRLIGEVRAAITKAEG
jgi:hypothetical protein